MGVIGNGQMVANSQSGNWLLKGLRGAWVCGEEEVVQLELEATLLCGKNAAQYVWLSVSCISYRKPFVLLLE